VISGDSNHTAKILCVDDEPNVLRALRRLFMDEDQFEILTAESGAAGLEILSQEQDIAVVMSDYRMPEMNGVEFLRQVHEKCPKTMRIVLSGYADTASVVEAINVGHIYKFIPKPWNDDELRINVARAVETYFLNEENCRLSAELSERNIELQEINANLENLVQQRTEALELRSFVLQLAQDVLDSIPVVVFGVDDEDLVVQANGCAHKLFAGKGMLLGEKVTSIFSVSLLAFLEQVKLVGSSSDTISCEGKEFKALGCYLNDDRRRGMIITLLPKGED
jgi:two-component system NtrC family sensor kinase